MHLNDIKDATSGLSDADFSLLYTWIVYEESGRRDRARADEATAADVLGHLRDEGALPAPDHENPEAWSAPGTSHAAMYLLGDRVAHGGKVWESTHPGLNHWEPGAVGIDYRIWKEVVAEEDATDPETGAVVWRAGLTLEAGDIVIFDGKTYEVIQAHTSADHWLPSDVASLYKAVTG